MVPDGKIKIILLYFRGVITIRKKIYLNENTINLGAEREIYNVYSRLV